MPLFSALKLPAFCLFFCVESWPVWRIRHIVLVWLIVGMLLCPIVWVACMPRMTSQSSSIWCVFQEFSLQWSLEIYFFYFGVILACSDWFQLLCSSPTSPPLCRWGSLTLTCTGITSRVNGTGRASGCFNIFATYVWLLLLLAQLPHIQHW